MSSRYTGTAAALVLATGFLSAAAWLSTAEAAKESKEAAVKTAAPAVSVERGRYIAQVGGCNDCHTSHYPESGGTVPEKDWLKGDQLGWKGAWGTTYPANLRISLAGMTEDQWVRFAKSTQLRPPMPWFALRDMSEADLRSFHRFVRSLGPVGEPAPAYVPPGQVPKGPFIQFPEPPAATQKSASR